MSPCPEAPRVCETIRLTDATLVRCVPHLVAEVPVLAAARITSRSVRASCPKQLRSSIEVDHVFDGSVIRSFTDSDSVFSPRVAQPPTKYMLRGE